MLGGMHHLCCPLSILVLQSLQCIGHDITMSKRTSLLATSIFTSSSAIVACAFLISIFKNKKHRSVFQD
jgi:hypothetical protein